MGFVLVYASLAGGVTPTALVIKLTILITLKLFSCSDLLPGWARIASYPDRAYSIETAVQLID